MPVTRRDPRPEQKTLYEPSTEHDACGFGFVADIKGRGSHAIVRDALTVLVNLEHRGASGSEANTAMARASSSRSRMRSCASWRPRRK